MSKKVLARQLNEALLSTGQRIGRIGLSPDMKPYLYTQGYAFNHMNFAGLVIGVIRLLYIVLWFPATFPPAILWVNSLPVLGCLAMMVSMRVRAYTFTIYFSFLVFPLLLFVIAFYVHDRGVIAYFLPYLVYPFFFLNRKWKIIVSFVYTAALFMGSFLVEIFHDHSRQAQAHHLLMEFITFTGSMVLSFISLYSIKSQVWQYQKKTLRQKGELEAMNNHIRKEQEKLRESNRVKDKLFSIISHDLRVPIQGLHLLLSDEVDPQTGLAILAENLPELKAELQKTSQLFDDLLDWSKLQISNNAFSPQKIDILQLALKVRETLQQRAVEKDIQVAIAIENTCMYADKDIMEIILRNLVSNAIKFTPAHGAVAITGRLEQNTYTLQVEDNGIGIDATAMEKIIGREFYTSFGTGNEKGTGLGLLICAELVEKSEGYLSIQSTIGKGTKVSVSIPRQPFKQPASQESLPHQGAGRFGED